MIERQRYKEFIQEQGELESGTAQGWGYHINPKEFIALPKTTKHKIKVTKIDPMKRNVHLPPSKQLLKVEEELLMLQNQQKLNQLTEKAKTALEKGQGDCELESAAIKMMKQRIEEYNFILEHRHIIEKHSEQARRILGIKKTKRQIICEEIAALKERLSGSTFTEVIDINKKITKLYRQFEKVANCRKESEENLSLRSRTIQRSKTQVSGSIITNSNINTSKLSPNPRTQKKSSFNASDQYKKSEKLIELRDIVVMQELKESSEGDSESDMLNNHLARVLPHSKEPQSLILRKANPVLKKTGSEHDSRRRFYSHTEQSCEKPGSKSKMNVPMVGNFINADLMQKGRTLDRNVEESEMVLEVWRHRIDSNREKNSSSMIRQKSNSRKFKRSLKPNIKQQAAIDRDQQKSKERLEKAKRILEFRMLQVKQQMEEKEKVFSILIKRKQSRYQRIPGTQLLKMNDAKEVAKIYLGTADSQSRQNDSQSRQNKTAYGTTFQKGSKESDQEGPEWLKIEKESEEHYWSMMRNQKINLLLKSTKG